MSDPYLYEGTSVLKNKLGIRQQEKKEYAKKETIQTEGSAGKIRARDERPCPFPMGKIGEEAAWHIRRSLRYGNGWTGQWRMQPMKRRPGWMVQKNIQ